MVSMEFSESLCQAVRVFGVGGVARILICLCGSLSLCPGPSLWKVFQGDSNGLKSQ